jgi:hypothetical protein
MLSYLCRVRNGMSSQYCIWAATFLVKHMVDHYINLPRFEPLLFDPNIPNCAALSVGIIRPV